MLKSGLISISFRELSCEEIIKLSKECGLEGIEWGSDVHVVPDKLSRAEEVGRLTAEAGLKVTSYGSYYRTGVFKSENDIMKNFLPLIAAAKALNAPVIRLWAGKKGSADVSENERADMIKEILFLSDMAKEENITLAFECHPDTLTDDISSTLRLMKEVGRDNVKMYWQPNQHKSFEYNLDALRKTLPYLVNVHTFNWHGDKLKESLALALNEWREYAKIAESSGKEHYFMLEFMPDGRKESLKREADTLINKLITENNTLNKNRCL